MIRVFSRGLVHESASPNKCSELTFGLEKFKYIFLWNENENKAGSSLDRLEVAVGQVDRLEMGQRRKLERFQRPE